MTRRALAVRWAVVAVLAVAGVVLLWSLRTGSCPAGGAAAPCTSAPTVGEPAAWVLTVAGALLAGRAVSRLVRLSAGGRGRPVR